MRVSQVHILEKLDWLCKFGYLIMALAKLLKGIIFVEFSLMQANQPRLLAKKKKVWTTDRNSKGIAH